jgi:hypothetical protein
LARFGRSSPARSTSEMGAEAIRELRSSSWLRRFGLEIGLAVPYCHVSVR